jgi:hypothetical protein
MGQAATRPGKSGGRNSVLAIGLSNRDTLVYSVSVYQTFQAVRKRQENHLQICTLRKEGKDRSLIIF